MQSDLLGAHAMGVRNVLLVTGDPQRRGDYAFTSGVLDVDSIGLTNVVSRLNRGVDVGGEPLSRQTCYHIGVAVNPTALNLDEELRRFAYKVEAGAEFAITRAGLRPAARSSAFLARVEGYGIPIIAGLWPFDSQLNAEFMANEVPGVAVPGGAAAPDAARGGRRRRLPAKAWRLHAKSRTACAGACRGSSWATPRDAWTASSRCSKSLATARRECLSGSARRYIVRNFRAVPHRILAVPARAAGRGNGAISNEASRRDDDEIIHPRRTPPPARCR